MIFNFEGIDGCGKSRVAEEIAKALGCETLAFPYDNAVTGPPIREYLRHEWQVDRHSERAGAWQLDDWLGAIAHQALQVCNRWEKMPRLWESEGDKNLVVCRYAESGWVYGRYDGLPAPWLEAINRAMVKPHLSILLEVDPAEGLRRCAARDGVKPPERYEGDLRRCEALAVLYRECWKRELFSQRYRVVDANQPLKAVVGAVLAEIAEVRTGRSLEVARRNAAHELDTEIRRDADSIEHEAEDDEP